MKTITKNKLINWMSKEVNDCGKTNYFGYPMTIEAFEKEMKKRTLNDLKETVYNWSTEGQAFVESFK